MALPLLALALAVSSLGADAPEETPWAFRPVVRPEVPRAAGDQAGHIGNPIDAFLARGLGEDGLTPAPEADRRTLIRRLCFDLTGLPPTPEQVEDFLADEAPEAYERLVDRLLASPHYGERWGRHWLDLMRYGETWGFEFDYDLHNAWRYRDYVIRAFNDDLVDVTFDDFQAHNAGVDRLRRHDNLG